MMKKYQYQYQYLGSTIVKKIWLAQADWADPILNQLIQLPTG